MHREGDLKEVRVKRKETKTKAKIRRGRPGGKITLTYNEAASLPKLMNVCL